MRTILSSGAGLLGATGATKAVNLSQLGRGQRAVVRSVAGEPSLTIRLMELGLLPGATVRVVRVAPLGDPLVVALRGAELSLRSAEAKLVEIEKAP